jgi:hypothetical protein
MTVSPSVWSGPQDPAVVPGRAEGGLSSPIDLECPDRERAFDARPRRIDPRFRPDEVDIVMTYGRHETADGEAVTPTRWPAESRSSAASATCRGPITA